MTTKRQVALGLAGESLQIPVPPDFSGARSSDSDEIHINTGFQLLTVDEIQGVIKPFLENLPYRQTLAYGGTFIDPNDALLQYSHDEIDEVEARVNLTNTRHAPTGGERSVLERVLIIREQGYAGTGAKSLPS